jgi:DNA-binding NtrC family response regulator
VVVAICLQHKVGNLPKGLCCASIPCRLTRPAYCGCLKDFPRRVLHQVSMSDSVGVLVLAREELISALLGLLVETTGHTVFFAEPDERAEDAMRRIGPQVAIVDCDHRDCTDDLVLAANDVGARLILFSASRDPDYVRRVAAPSHSQSFTFPIEAPQLDSMIRRQVA